MDIYTHTHSANMQCIHINLENAEKDPFGIFVSYTISITNLQYINTAVYMCIILMHERLTCTLDTPRL